MSSFRSRQGTEAQLEALVEFLEQDPEMARGHLKTACARRKVKQFWERVVPRLNSLEGATKTNKQWMKYWTDKKTNIKKKAAERAAVRRRTGGGVESIRHLTETEERILQLLGGEGYAVGDRHLRFDLIQHSSEATATVTSPTSLSILPHIVNHSSEATATVTSPTSLSILPHIVNSRQDTPAYYGFEPVSPRSPLPVFSDGGRNTTIQNSESSHQPRTELAPSPTRPTRPHVSANTRHEECNRQPPSQRRSQLTTLSKGFLRIEERRLALDEKQTQANLIAAQAQREMAAALRCLGDGNRAMADAVQEGVNTMREIANRYFI